MKKIATYLTLSLAMSLSTATYAQDNYPDKPVTIVVPFAAGGPVDFVARQLSSLLSNETGQSYVVQNIGGGQGIPAMNRVVRAQPDGYTLFLAGASHVINQPLATDATREVASLLQPVSLVATSPQVLVVSSTLPTKTTKELIEYAKKNPNVVNFGSPGIGSISHLGLELFASQTKADVVHVPYSGISAISRDLQTGEVHALLTSMPSIKPLIDSGKIRAIGLTSASVGKDTKDIPLLSETLPGMEYSTWYGMYVSKDTPTDLVQKINAQLKKALSDPEFSAKMEAVGTKLTHSSPAELQNLVNRDSKLWTDAVSTSSLKTAEKKQ